MSIYRGVSDCASEPGGCPGRADLPIGICILASQPEVQHVDLPHRLRSSANWNKVLSLNFPGVNCINSLPAKFEGLMSLCKNPTSWIASMPFSIWYPSLQCINLHKLFFAPQSCLKDGPLGSSGSWCILSESKKRRSQIRVSPTHQETVRHLAASTCSNSTLISSVASA